jgi:hypothetical protein
MKRYAILAVGALLSLTACGSGDSGTTPTPTPPATEDTFDSNASLSNYTGYTDGGANWSVQNGQLVGTGPANQSVLVRGGLSFTNGWVEAVSSRADDAGLVLRFRNSGDYYLLAFRDNGAPPPRDTYSLAVYHHVNGEYREMALGSVAWPRGTTHTVRFEAAGAQLKVYFDGSLQGTVTPGPDVNDPAPYAGAGQAGVRVYGATASWVSTFDTFRWHVGS